MRSSQAQEYRHPTIRNFQSLTTVVSEKQILYLDNVVESKESPVVLLAGWPQTVYAWRKVISEMKQKRRVVAIDLPGVGGSEPIADCSTGSVAQHLYETLRQLKLMDRKISLVTHDIGSWVGYSFAAKFPGSVSSVVLIEAGIPGVSDLAKIAFSLEHNHKIWQFSFNQLETLPEILVEGKEREFLNWLFKRKSHVQDAISSDDLDVYYSAYRRKNAMKDGFDYYRALPISEKQNIEFASKKIQMPVLVIGGDRGVGEAMAVAVRKVASKVQGIVMKDTGHYIPEERPSELMQTINEFWQANSKATTKK